MNTTKDSLKSLDCKYLYISKFTVVGISHSPDLQEGLLLPPIVAEWYSGVQQSLPHQNVPVSEVEQTLWHSLDTRVHCKCCSLMCIKSSKCEVTSIARRLLGSIVKIIAYEHMEIDLVLDISNFSCLCLGSATSIATYNCTNAHRTLSD